MWSEEKPITDLKPNGGLAQLVEHLLCTQGVRSSNLLTSTIIKKRDLKGLFFVALTEFQKFEGF